MFFQSLSSSHSGSFLAEEEVQKHCEDGSLSFPLAAHPPLGFCCQDPDVGPSWPLAKGCHPGVFKPTLHEIHALPITSLFPSPSPRTPGAEGYFSLYGLSQPLDGGKFPQSRSVSVPLPTPHHLCPHTHLQPLRACSTPV